MIQVFAPMFVNYAYILFVVGCFPSFLSHSIFPYTKEHVMAVNYEDLTRNTHGPILRTECHLLP